MVGGADGRVKSGFRSLACFCDFEEPNLGRSKEQRVGKKQEKY